MTLGKMTSLRLSEEQYNYIKSESQKAGITVGQYIRELIDNDQN